MGYEIFEPKLPLKKIKGCQNSNYQPDLLLIDRNFHRASRKIRIEKKHVYEMPIYKHKDTDIIKTFMELEPPFDNVLDYFD